MQKLIVFKLVWRHGDLLLVITVVMNINGRRDISSDQVLSLLVFTASRRVLGWFEWLISRSALPQLSILLELLRDTFRRACVLAIIIRISVDTFVDQHCTEWVVLPRHIILKDWIEIFKFLPASRCLWSCNDGLDIGLGVNRDAQYNWFKRELS